MKEIIYIGGYGRSGSTILDISLSQHDNIIGLGEITNIFSEWEDLKEKRFWDFIIKNFEDQYHKVSINELKKITYTVQSKPKLLIDKKKLKIYYEAWGLLLNLIIDDRNIIIVDSSKTTRLSLYRPIRLKEMGFNVNFILLSRSFSDIKKSIKKGSNKDIEKGLGGFNLFTLFKFYIGYTYTNILTWVLYGKNKYQLNYNNFTKNPVLELNNYFKNIGREDIYFSSSNFKDMNPGVGVSGNRMRRKIIKEIISN